MLGLLAAPAGAPAQAPPSWDWRPLGTPRIELSLASAATGPIERVWFDAQGHRLYARTASGAVFSTRDGNRWRREPGAPPPASAASITVLNGLGPARVWADPARPPRLWAIASQLYRSDDGGLSWLNLTARGARSIIGDNFHDMAISPADPDVIVVANDFGVWRSADGGLSWSGLNDNLPNLPARRIVALPEGPHGTRIEVENLGIFEWAPGERSAWRPTADASLENESRLRRLLSGVLETEITAVAVAGDFIYAGSSDGRLWVSPDQGRSWRLPFLSLGGAPVARIWVDPAQPHIALAALTAPGADRVVRTTNGGLFWDDLTANLPQGAIAYSAAADRSSGAVYVATSRGVFYMLATVDLPGPPTTWNAVPPGLPQAPVRDVRLDAQGNRIFVALEGYGVYTATAPHRLRNPRLANGADFSTRPAAPGSLLSVVGARVERARVGSFAAPVLSASDTESQVQVPYEVQGDAMLLDLWAQAGRLAMSWPLASVAPAIVVDRDGSPLALDGETGVMVDAMNPARAGSRLQVLATGLGEVKPPWPAGLPAPLADPPAVVTPLRAYLDGAPVPVTRAVLAPGYAGLYLIEVQLPEIVNRGPAEFHLEAAGRVSNRVRIYLEP
ncbi:MAG: hypothetical protein ACP5U2_05580 [Bryobacteraceae bacterium]